MVPGKGQDTASTVAANPSARAVDEDNLVIDLNLNFNENSAHLERTAKSIKYQDKNMGDVPKSGNENTNDIDNHRSRDKVSLVHPKS